MVIVMLCPHGHGVMIKGRHSWVCEECGGRAPFEAGNRAEIPGDAIAAFPDLHHLPSLLAIPLHGYARSDHPVIRLHRLCDFVEILTRVLSIISLGEIRKRAGDSQLPEALLRELRPHIERPTFGRWRGMLETLVKHLGPSGPLVVPELPSFVTNELLPALPGGDGPPESCIISLRNFLVHSGGITEAAARGYHDRWGPWLANLIVRLTFLSEIEIYHLRIGEDEDRPITAQSLTGTNPAGEPALLADDLGRSIKELVGHVVLIRQSVWLDLWPLCDFGRASWSSIIEARQGSADSPMVYMKAERRKLMYAALGVEWPHAERTDVVDHFRSLFQLDAPHPEQDVAASETGADFEREIQFDADAMVGRVQEIRRIKEAIKASVSGIFWVGGSGGIGKSFLMAKVA